MWINLKTPITFAEFVDLPRMEFGALIAVAGLGELTPREYLLVSAETDTHNLIAESERIIAYKEVTI